MTQNAKHFYEFGHFRLDSSSRLLLKDGKVIRLKRKAVDTLLALLESRGQVLGKDVLRERVWPDSNVDESSLTQNIYELRQVLGHDVIQNVPRVGYLFAAEVREVEVEPSRATAASSTPFKNASIWAATVVFFVVAILAGWVLLGRFRSRQRQFLSTNIPAETQSYRSAYGGRVSPDGKRVAFLARSQSSDKRFIFVRRLDSDEVTPIEESAADSPFFWSNDGTSLYFVAGGYLKQKRMEKETIQKIAKLDGALSWFGVNAPRGTVNSDGVILLGSTKGILRVLPDGTTSQITISPTGTAHTEPYFLPPDGGTFLFLAISHPEGGELVKMLCSGRLDAPRTFRQIGPISSRVEWNADRLLYARDGALYARPWSLKKGSFAGDEVLVTRHVYSNASTSDADFSVARDGLLVVKDVASPSLFERIRPGSQPIPIPWQGQIVGITLARDRELAVLASHISETPGRNDLWVWDPKDDSRRKLTSLGNNYSPVLNAPGDEVYYAAERKNLASIYKMSIATGAETLVLLAENSTRNPRGISSDGRLLLYTSIRQLNSDLYCIDLRNRRVTPIADTPNAKEGETGRFSPDGTQVVFVSDVSGEERVYVTPYPPDGTTARLISPTSGWRPRWSNDGKKIYYLHRRGLIEYDVLTHAVVEIYRADADIGQMEPTARGDFLVVIAPVEPANRIVSNWQDNVGREK